MSNSVNQPNYSYGTLLKDVWYFLRPYKGRFLAASFLRASTDMTYLYTVYTLAGMVSFFTKFIRGESLLPFWFLLFTWGATQIYVNVFRQVAKYVCYRVAELVKLDSHLKSIRYLSQLDISWHEAENAGNKLKKLNNGGEGMERLLRVWIDSLIKITVNFFGMTLIIASIDGRVASILLIFLITYTAIAIPLGRRASDAARKVNQHEEDLSGLVFETLNNIRSVKVMGMFGGLLPILVGETSKIYQAVTKRIFCFRSKSAIQSLWSLFFRIGCFIVIALSIAQGRYEVGFFVLFNFYFTNLQTSVEELSDISQDLAIARHHMERLHTIFAEKIGIDDDTDKHNFPRQWKKISVRDVSFAYGNNMVLDAVSFDINRGEKVGIVGLSGAGKSTLFKLLLKEYEGFTGDILFDAVSIRDIKKSAYFTKAAVVLQDTEVFNFSLKNNITISNPDAAKDNRRLKLAIDTAHVTDFMHKLPEGIETLIGEKGIKLSGGERQRVGIARAIFRNPDILFMDEATSHLDLESEEKIKDSLAHFFKDVTAVVIAHRLTTIQKMDRILLFENGRLLEQGNFATLMKLNGRFFDLWQKQKF